MLLMSVVSVIDIFVMSVMSVMPVMSVIDGQRSIGCELSINHKQFVHYTHTLGHNDSLLLITIDSL